jgi:hypothetical protein
MAKYYILFPSSFAHDQDVIVSPTFINQFSWVFSLPYFFYKKIPISNFVMGVNNSGEDLDDI